MGKNDLLNLYNQAVRDYDNRVCRFADKLLIDGNLAKDVTQETFLRLWQHRDNIDFAKVKSWLFTTAYRLCMDLLTRRKKDGAAVISTEPSFEMENPDLRKIINDALSLLSETQRSVLLLKDYEGYSYAEIGEMIQLSESQVKVYLFRARQKVKEHIGDLKLVI